MISLADTAPVNDLIVIETAIVGQRSRLDEHPAAVYLARLSAGDSRRSMTSALSRLAALFSSGQRNMYTLDWSNLRYQHTAAMRSLLAGRYAPTTANKMLSALRGVLREAWRLGQMNSDDYLRAVDLSAVRGSSLPVGRALHQAELRALFVVCEADPTPAGRRDAALLAVMYNCGLRRSEVVMLDLADYESDTGTIKVLHGKGNKQRLVYAAETSRDAIGVWLRVRGNVPGPLFCRINRGHRLVFKYMTGQAVRKTLLKRAAMARVADFSPHDLRRTMISDLLDAGIDISTVQHLAGHANITTTARYDRRGEVTKRKAAEMMSIPYQHK